MPECVVFNGKEFHKYKGHNYFSRGNKLLHREVWKFYNGEIPAGYHVHHKNNSPKSTTDIKKLECIPGKDHFSLHAKLRAADPKWLARQREHLRKINHLAKAWHSTKEGKEFHRKISAMARDKFVPIEKPCLQCHAKFIPKQLGSIDKFCSNKCKSAWRRASGRDNITKRCEECNKDFTCNKYSKNETCSRSCAMRKRHRTPQPRVRSSSGRFARICSVGNTGA